MPRDNQRSRVYSLDRRLQDLLKETVGSYHRNMSLKECEFLVTLCLAHAGLDINEPLEVKPGKGRRRPCGGSRGVNLPRFARHPEIVIHEAVHVIHARTFGWEVHEPHGAEFVRMLIWLLNKTYGLDTKRMLALAKEERVKVVSEKFIKELKDFAELKQA